MEDTNKPLTTTPTTEALNQDKKPARKKNRKDRGGWFNSIRVRWAVQIAFFIVVLVIGWQFYTFVTYCEAGGKGFYLPRPPGVESFLPDQRPYGYEIFFRDRQDQYHPSRGLCHLRHVAPDGALFQEGFLRLDLPYRRHF